MTSESLTILRADALLDVSGAIVAVFGQTVTTGLLYGARQICIATGSGSGFVSGGVEVDLADIYQADFFAGSKTLTWRRTDGNIGIAVVLAEDESGLVIKGWSATGNTAGAFAIDQKHLFWGKHDLSKGAWTRLSDARIGGLQVPIAVPRDHKAVLHAKAWFRPLPEACGNPQFIGCSWGPFKTIAIPRKRDK